jgi:hypothetical protein
LVRVGGEPWRQQFQCDFPVQFQVSRQPNLADSSCPQARQHLVVLDAPSREIRLRRRLEHVGKNVPYGLCQKITEARIVFKQRLDLVS